MGKYFVRDQGIRPGTVVPRRRRENLTRLQPFVEYLRHVDNRDPQGTGNRQNTFVIVVAEAQSNRRVGRKIDENETPAP